MTNSDLKKMEDHLEEIHTQNKRLESSKLGVDNQLCDLGMEIEEVKRERDTYKVGQGKTARELKTKNLELKKLKEVCECAVCICMFMR